MTTTDSIFFIKETKTCQYVLVIHTPRLCGQPGFKSPREDLRDTPLRCRKVVDTLEGTDPTLPESPLPFQRREPKPLPAPRPSATAGDKKQSNGKDGANNDANSHLIKAALNALLGRQKESGTTNKKAERAGSGSGSPPAGKPEDGSGSGNSGGGGAGGSNAPAEKKLEQRFVAVSLDENGELKIEKFLGQDIAGKGGDNDGTEEEEEDEEVMEIELSGGEDAARLMRILREAGYDARLPNQEESDDEPLKTHDEL